MRTVWRGTIIHDYEESFRTAKEIELQLYGDGLSKAPEIFLTNNRFRGSTRSPGVVDVPEEDFVKFLTEFSEQIFDPNYTSRLWQKYLEIVGNLNAASEKFELSLKTQRVTVEDFDSYFDATSDIMAFHTFNWILPFNLFEEHLSKVLGEVAGRDCLLILVSAPAQSHLSVFHKDILTKASQAANNETGLTNTSLGFLQRRRGEFENFEDPNSLSNYVERFVSIESDPLTALKQFNNTQLKSERRRDAYFAEALIKSISDDELYSKTLALGDICALAATEEEQRKIFFLRAIHNFQLLGKDLLGQPDLVSYGDFRKLLRSSKACSA